MRHFAGLLRQGFVVIGAGGERIERQVKLVFPAEFEARFRHGVIADLCPRMTLRQVGRMCGNFVGDQTLLNVLFVRQTEMLFRGDVAEHRAAKPADHRRANPGGEVVVTRCDIGGQRPQSVERRFMAVFQLLGHVAADHLHRHMARAFDHHLHVIFPGNFGQLAQGVQLGKLGFVVGVANGSRTQTVAQRQRDVVRGADLADFAEVLVQEVFLMMGQAPLRHN
ncbi:hypothetical protein D3C75_342040 [compost metagenome]